MCVCVCVYVCVCVCVCERARAPVCYPLFPICGELRSCQVRARGLDALNLALVMYKADFYFLEVGIGEEPIRLAHERVSETT